MAWLWTDTLAALLMEADRLDPAEVRPLLLHLVAYRLPDDGDPLDLARKVLQESRAGAPTKATVATE